MFVQNIVLRGCVCPLRHAMSGKVLYLKHVYQFLQKIAQNFSTLDLQKNISTRKVKEVLLIKQR